MSWQRWLEEEQQAASGAAGPYLAGSHRFGDRLVGRGRVNTLAAHGLGFSRGGRSILTGVDLTAVAGEVLAVTGPSGSGKSTLLAVLAGLERPDTGTVTVDGAAPRPGVPDGFGLVLQGYGLVSLLTAAENVEVALQGRGLSRAEVRDRAAAALAQVKLEAVADHLVEQLSGGQQQRVAVARAVVGDPAVLLADEFTAELDAQSKSSVLALVLGVARRGTVVVVATHDLQVAADCHRQLRLVDGRVAPAVADRTG